ncbi:MAG: gamma-glutamyl-gamma-aminobutyrate hydrolase family protein [Candidatus Moraniibacteriota bacterium]
MMERKPFLMIQFRTDAGKQLEQISVQEKLAAYQEAAPDIQFFDAFDSENDALFAAPETWLASFQGVILGGSSEFYFGGNTSDEFEAKHQAMLVRLQPFMEYILEQDFLTLGICFGHQFLAHALGTSVVADPHQAETGSLCVALSDTGRQDPLFVGMPESWKAFFVHRDSAMELPRESVLLGSGERSQVGAFRHKNRIYGVQFHPELDRHDLPSRLALHPEYVAEGADVFLSSVDLVPHAGRILHNFVELCRR